MAKTNQPLSIKTFTEVKDSIEEHVAVMSKFHSQLEYDHEQNLTIANFW